MLLINWIFRCLQVNRLSVAMALVFLSMADWRGVGWAGETLHLHFLFPLMGLWNDSADDDDDGKTFVFLFQFPCS